MAIIHVKILRAFDHLSVCLHPSASKYDVTCAERNALRAPQRMYAVSNLEFCVRFSANNSNLENAIFPVLNDFQASNHPVIVLNTKKNLESAYHFLSSDFALVSNLRLHLRLRTTLLQ